MKNAIRAARFLTVPTLLSLSLAQAAPNQTAGSLKDEYKQCMKTAMEWLYQGYNPLDQASYLQRKKMFTELTNRLSGIDLWRARSSDLVSYYEYGASRGVSREVLDAIVCKVKLRDSATEQSDPAKRQCGLSCGVTAQ